MRNPNDWVIIFSEKEIIKKCHLDLEMYEIFLYYTIITGSGCGRSRVRAFLRLAEKIEIILAVPILILIFVVEIK